MHVGLRDHRGDEGHVVDTGREVRQKIAHPLSTVAMLSPAPWALHHRAGLTLEKLHFFAGIEPLPVPLHEERLIVKGITLACSAGHEELDDALGLGPVVKPAAQLRTGSHGPSEKQPCLPKEVRERDSPKAPSKPPQELSSVKRQ